MKQKEREKLYQKFSGCCAYCGDRLQKGWHADHIEPMRRYRDGTIENPENDTMDNLNPSCPSCNRLKNSFSIEEFRNNIQNYVNSLNKYSVQYKVAKKYGLVEETNKKVTFRFEE